MFCSTQTWSLSLWHAKIKTHYSGVHKEGHCPSYMPKYKANILHYKNRVTVPLTCQHTNPIPCSTQKESLSFDTPKYKPNILQYTERVTVLWHAKIQIQYSALHKQGHCPLTCQNTNPILCSTQRGSLSFDLPEHKPNTLQYTKRVNVFWPAKAKTQCSAVHQSCQPSTRPECNKIWS